MGGSTLVANYDRVYPSTIPLNVLNLSLCCTVAFSSPLVILRLRLERAV